MARSNLVVGVWVAHLNGRGPVRGLHHKVRRDVPGQPTAAIRIKRSLE